MKEAISVAVNDSARAVEQLNTEESLTFIAKTAEMIAEAFNKGNKVIVAGNGGSLCDAMHFAEELTGRFRGDRMALPAIALADSSHITCVANDFGFDSIFSRGVEAYGKPGDIFVGLSTSGNSPNIIKAFDAAKERELITVSFLGKDGGKLKGFADAELMISGFKTSDRVQEAHMTAIHIIIEMVEKILFG
ncbi:MAG: D-sedoheptulose 7-phosphate isomerase [Waddliaceae bacterium]|jgi:D-sedoheptulose 7-phosphate isomerase|nr:D-sedoheptulose 7-phosphate isomerase [Waddliaceae bacterium]MBT3578540.1 D-sedoheptulose 7-phosphate isomerase [Waddliaceae bacterium]MBT4444685.1 D-sedoheptulose 7-phosphate isomerase [Waddliaceae bacterium]MBT6928716.1 D-sedoheptulose 7-phosphate isomerase [Waddliaceae bacterium]MBT7264948.1 D-sedoheptulose 7-phosphate isomerase [Waddliaceae bacterium]